MWLYDILKHPKDHRTGVKVYPSFANDIIFTTDTKITQHMI